MSAPEDDALLVGSGGFKVDRAHALRKLKEYQLPYDVGGWMMWLRAAAAAGASTADLTLDAGRCAVRFLGEPYSRAELEDPFAPLFAPAGRRRERGVHLALGLLQALRNAPEELTVESGEGPARLRLSVRSLDDMDVSPAPDPDPRTVLSVRWRFSQNEINTFLTRGYTMYKAVPLLQADRLSLTGARLARWPAEAASGTPFALGGALGRLALPDFYTPDDSHLMLYKLGVFVCEHREPFPWAKVVGWVNDDKMALSASLTGAVRDARFAGLMRLVGREAEALLREAAAGHPDLMTRARAACRADPAAAEAWAARHRWGPQAGRDAAVAPLWRRLLALEGPERTAGRRLVLDAANRTLWLRDAAARLNAPGRTPPAGLREAVAAALAAAEDGV